jgi:hypothetical protein
MSKGCHCGVAQVWEIAILALPHRHWAHGFDLRWRLDPLNAATPNGQRDVKSGLRATVTQTLAVLLPVVGVITTALASVNKGWVKALLIAGVVLTTAGVTLLTLYKDRQAKKAQEQAIAAVANLDTAVTGAGQPLVAVLGRVMLESSPAKLANDVDTLRLMAITGATMQCGKIDGACRLRSTYYRLQQGRLERVGDHVGRPTGRPPRAAFKPTDGKVSRRVIEVAKGNRVIRIEDVDAAKPGEFEDYTGREYKAIIAAPVRAGDRSFGMLFVDSDRAYSLTEADAEYVNLVAGVLGAGYAHYETVIEIHQLATANGDRRDSTIGSVAPRPRAEHSVQGDEQAYVEKGDDDAAK